MRTSEIRTAYLDFFAARGHRVVASSSLVPVDDPTLLFTNSGMVQFKGALTGQERPSYRRAVSCQRCMRAGGKHNDLENVGYTRRHHTLFEMLGNFSFGDYFKAEAIAWAWEFVTDVLALPADRLWITVHPTDDEAKRIWVEDVGFDPARVVAHEENFWTMGDTGPCGPDSEIFFDLGDSVPGGPPGSADEDGDRFCEIWNLVFPQFDRAADGTLTPLPTPGVDTGMGLERVAAVLQGATSNYENDLMAKLVAAAGAAANIKDRRAVDTNPSLRVIADHIRAATFLIADGVMPSNEDRGYVLRRIIRRALRHGHKLDIREPFFHGLVTPVVDAMGGVYPEIVTHAERIAATLEGEEARFADTLRTGMALFEASVAGLAGTRIPGDVVFKLYDTHGFPVDLTADVARERGLTIDQAGFERAMEEQRARGRAAAGRFESHIEQRVRVDSAADFRGYDAVAGEANVLDVFKDGERVTALATGDAGIVVLDATPFYAEAGGQVGDIGEISANGAVFVVDDTTKSGNQHLHHGHVVAGTLNEGDRVRTAVDAPRRQAIRLNHSATHLLHAALRKTLGDHVEQKGSLVDAPRLRFDFSHPHPMTATEVASVERMVNDRIRENSAVTTDVMPFADAIDKGAVALFGEKYADEVRVLTMAEGFSVELCGGTHVSRTGDIGLLRIVAEAGIAAGVRRIEAVTGAHALTFVDANQRRLDDIVGIVRGSREDAPEKVRQLAAQARSLQRQVDALQSRLAASRGADLADTAIDINGIRVLTATVDGDRRSMLATLDSLKDRLGTTVVVLAHVADKVSLVGGVSKDLVARVNARDVVNFVGARVGARGGGRPDMAQAGGGDRPEQLAGALDSVADWVRQRTATD